jgi:hypothetical protein
VNDCPGAADQLSVRVFNGGPKITLEIGLKIAIAVFVPVISLIGARRCRGVADAELSRIKD